MLEKHPKQREFHDALHVQYKKQRLFLGANRSGKTTAGRHEALAHAYGYRFWDVPDLQLGADGDLPVRDSVHPKYWVRRSDGVPVRVPNTGMVLSGLPRLRGIGEVIHPGLVAALPEAARKRAKVLKGAQAVPDWIELANGSRILYATSEQDDSTFEGFSIDWFWGDEPFRQSVYNAIQARLFDQRGSLWVTLTPIGAAFSWMHETFCVSPRDDTATVTVIMRDNPANSAEDIEALRSNPNFSAKELRARLYGEPEMLGDRVFDSFDPAVHVVSSFMPAADWTHGLVVDPHHKRPAYLLWFAHDAKTNVYHYYREWPPGGDFHKLRSGALPPAELATVIRNAEGRTPATVRICDPRFGVADAIHLGVRETSFVNLMAQYGLNFDPNVPNTGKIEYGVGVVEDMLRYDKNFPIGPTNQPRIQIHDTCKSLIKGLMNFGYIDVKDPIRGLYRKVSEEYKDAVDALRYSVLYPLPLTKGEADRLQRITARDLELDNDYYS